MNGGVRFHLGSDCRKSYSSRSNQEISDLICPCRLVGEALGNINYSKKQICWKKKNRYAGNSKQSKMMFNEVCMIPSGPFLF